MESRNVEPLGECLAQLDRTADWLRSSPMARFKQDDAAVEGQARTLIDQVHALVQAVCSGLAQGASGLAVASEDCPPPGAVPDVLAVHALGDQLAVHAADLRRCARACAASGEPMPTAELTALAAAALQLRSGGVGLR